MLYMPIIALFYMENGLSVGGIMVVQAIYSTTIALAEIPSGYWADSFGRKRSITLGMTLLLIGFCILSLSYSFIGFSLAALIMGFGVSFISGTDSALLYDSLVVTNQEHQYLKYAGQKYSLATFAEASAAILGGWLAEYYGLRYTFYAQIFITLIGIFTALSLVEVNPQSSKDIGWPNIKRILRYVSLENKELRSFIFLSAIVGAATITIAWFAQPFFKDMGISAGWIGNLWALLNLTVALFSFIAHRIYGLISQRAVVLIIIVGIALNYIAIGFNYNYIGIAFIFFIYMLRGIATPVLLNFVNKITPSDMRATVLSIRSFIIRICFSLIAPFMGWISDTYTLSQAFIVAGITFGIMGLITIFTLKKSLE